MTRHFRQQDEWGSERRPIGLGPERNGRPEGAPPFTLDLIDSLEFASGDYRLSWLVNRVLVKGQPCILGGPKKSLKTNIGVDLAVSVAGGRQFLGEFFTPEPSRVCMLSGESGAATLQSVARRVAAAKGLRLADLDIFWGFNLPQLTDTLHVLALRDALEQHAIRLLLLDPLYLSLLAGQGADGLSASNLYQIGPLLLSVSRACLDVGCTPVLFHHFKITRKETYAEPQLEDLAYSGVQEFARQWILLGRRAPFDPDNPEGKNELWLNAGGSAGHSLLRAVNVYEGRLEDDFGGRTWRVEVLQPSDARAINKDARAAEKQRKSTRQQRDDESTALAVIDKLDPHRCGMATLTKIRQRCKDENISRDRTDRALERLVDQGILQETEVQVEGGKRARQPARAYCRPPGNFDAEL